MNCKSFRNAVVSLAMFVLPAACYAAGGGVGVGVGTHFNGTPETFVGLASNSKALLSIYLGKNGLFTGFLDHAEADHDVLSGRLDSTGFFSGTTDHGLKPYTLQVTGTDPATYVQLTGSSEGKEIIAYPAVYSTGETAAEKGTYTTLLPVSSSTGVAPAGTGYATVTVGKSGAGTVAGRLADGTSFMSSNVIVLAGTAHQLAVYDRAIYDNQGFVSGELVFTGSTVVSGSFNWDKPASSTGAYYRDGFQAVLDGMGEVYEKSDGDPISAGTLTVTAASPVVGFTQPFTVSHNVVTFGSPMITGSGIVAATVPKEDSNDAAMTITPSTGAVAGSFKEGGKVVAFKGLLLQGDGYAAGYYLAPEVSGTGNAGGFSLQ